VSAEAPPAPAANPPALLELDKVRTFYGRIEAVKGLSITVNEGEIVTLIGANGAGKSTTLRSIQGLTKAKAGTIRFAGKEIQNAPPHEIVQMGIAHSPEGRRLFPRMSVRENLEMGAFNRTDREGIGQTSSTSTRCSRASASGAASRRGRSRAASSRCARSGGR
jgi:branched-chain amino acid transport system ATP-binding protein